MRKSASKDASYITLTKQKPMKIIPKNITKENPEIFALFKSISVLYQWFLKNTRKIDLMEIFSVIKF